MEQIPSGMTRARHFVFRSTLIVAVAAAISLTGAIGATPAAAESEPGESAIQSPMASRSLMLDIAVAGDRLVAVGERGHILTSSDGGTSWGQMEVPTQTMLTAVAFVDDRTGVAVGHDSVIIRTTDGGTTWERVYSAPEDEAPFFDVWFSDATHGTAIGAYGSRFITTDAGVTWEFDALGDTDWHLHQIARTDGGRLFVAAEAGFIYRSDDDGSTWIEIPSPYEGSYFGVLPLADESLLIFGLRGHLFRSDDSGETWLEIDTGTVAMLNRGIVLEDGTIVIVGLGGTVLVSTDDGRSFTGHQQPGRRGISSIVETEGGSLVLVGEFGVRTATLAELTTVVEGGDR